MSGVPFNPGKLEKNPLWKEANDLAEYLYDKAEELPPEETWSVKRKLCNTSSDLIFCVAMGVGSTGLIGSEYDWNQARKFAAALKTMYRFAGRKKLLELDPAIMVRIDKLIEAIDKAAADDFKTSEAFSKRQADKSLKPWLEKYRIWQKMNDEKE